MTHKSPPKPKPHLTWPLLLLFGVPALILLAKQPWMPGSAEVAEYVSLLGVSDSVQHKLAHILFIPLGAMLVVLVRLTLGLRVLGPFRSILLAVAFQVTGVPLGLTFLAVTILIVVGIRPSIRALRLPYFGRITVMLSTVAVLMTLGVMASQWLDVALLARIAYFPIVVLCLVADAFARTMNQEGIRSAVWRGAMTAVVAVLLTWLAAVPAVGQALIHYPELLVAQIGGILFISRYMAWRTLERFNPKVVEDEEEEDENEEEPRWLDGRGPKRTASPSSAKKSSAHVVGATPQAIVPLPANLSGVQNSQASVNGVN